MTALWVACALALDGAVALVGGLFPERWLQRYRAELLGFASGTLLAAAMLDLLPEAIEIRGASALPWMLGGVLGLALLEALFATHDHHRHDGPSPLPFAVLGSDALHNTVDGMAIAAAFVSSPRLGVITSMAVIVHELPQEIADYAILRALGTPKRRALGWLASIQLTSALGAAAVLLGATWTGTAGVVLAIAAGTFVYIAVFELLPDVLGAPRRGHALLGLAVGVVAIWLLS